MYAYWRVITEINEGGDMQHSNLDIWKLCIAATRSPDERSPEGGEVFDADNV